MWIELLALRCTQAKLQAEYGTTSKKILLTDLIFSPEARGRLQDIRVDEYLSRCPRYLQNVVTDRIVLLSAAFELYFRHFLQDYLQSRAKYADRRSGSLTTEGNRIQGEVMKVRGLAERVDAFAAETGAKIRSLASRLPYLNDVYVLRNVLAHRAGLVDSAAAGSLRTISFRDGDRVVLTIDQVLALATPVVQVAESLDTKLQA